MKKFLSDLLRKLLAVFHRETPPVPVQIMQEPLTEAKAVTPIAKEAHTSDFEPIGPPGYTFDRQWNQWRDARGQLIGVGEDPYKHFEKVAIRDGNGPKYDEYFGKIRYMGAFKLSELSTEDRAYIYWKMRFTNQTPMSVASVVLNGTQTEANKMFEDGEAEHWNTGNNTRWEDYNGKVKPVF